MKSSIMRRNTEGFHVVIHMPYIWEGREVGGKRGGEVHTLYWGWDTGKPWSSLYPIICWVFIPIQPAISLYLTKEDIVKDEVQRYSKWDISKIINPSWWCLKRRNQAWNESINIDVFLRFFDAEKDHNCNMTCLKPLTDISWRSWIYAAEIYQHQPRFTAFVKMRLQIFSFFFQFFSISTIGIWHV